MPRLSLLSVAQWLAVISPILLVAGPAPFDIGASLIAVLFLLHSALHRDGTWLRTRWVQLALLLGLYMCLRNLFLPDMGGALGRSASFLRYPLFAAALAFWVLRDSATSRRLWQVLAACVSFLVLDTFWQYATGADIFGRLPQMWEGYMRLTGPFSAPRVGVTIVWLIFPTVLPLLLGASLRGKLFGVALLLASGAAVFMSGERTALLLWLMGCGLCLLLQPMLRKLLLVGAVLAAVAVGLLSMSNPLLMMRQYVATRDQVLAFDQSVYGRTWIASAEVGAAHPFFGVGGKQFTTECRKPIYGDTDAHSLKMRCPMHPHHLYLEFLSEYGGIGLALLLALVFAMARDAWRSRALWLVQPLLVGLVVTMVLRFWPISVTPSYFVSWVAMPLWLMIGWFYARLQAARA